ncbi:SET domain containing [Cryptosporidium sp. chipmunk genotype I]|uniref:SET domain containing n=1 Tax=Cryptosporidium sp. chipmunk genotype I TaxID=1280935 RepID=UPI00351AA493|nr:SET domain containing [Cryptosporidium sp. chipmunk genotype I]
MDSNFSEDIGDMDGEFNCIFRKIKFDIPAECEGNQQDGVLIKGQTFNIRNSPCKSPIFLILKPETPKLSEEINQSNLNNTDYNVSISIKVSPILRSDNKLSAPSESSQGVISKNGDNTSKNFTPFNDKNSGNYKSSTRTTGSSPVVNDEIQISDKHLLDVEERSVPIIEETRDQSISEKKQESKLTKKISSIKSSIKRQLTNNRYVDICKNPEWPFTKQTSKVFSKNEQVRPRSQRGRKTAQKGTEADLSIENKDSNLISKNSSRGRARQWLESLSTLFDGVYTQRSTLGRSAGLGLFSDRHFQKNDIITEFVGWVIDRKEALRLRSEGKATHICDLVKPSLYLDGEKDPKPFIGGGSFANDGSTFLGGPGNNSKFWKWYDEREGRSRVFLKATQEIQPGEEIFVGYCKDYWVDFAEKEDSTNSSSKTNHVNSVSRNSNKTVPGGKKRGRKRSIKVLEPIENLEMDSKLTDDEKCSLEFVPEMYLSPSLKKIQGKNQPKSKEKSLYWDTVLNWSTSDDDEGNK